MKTDYMTNKQIQVALVMHGNYFHAKRRIEKTAASLTC